MSRKLKRTLSMSIILVLIAALAGVYFLRPVDEEYEEDNAPPALATTFLIQRDEHDVASVRFIWADQEYTMTSNIDENDTVTWQWQPNPEFILQPWWARDKVRPAWHFTVLDTAHEDTQGLDLAQFDLSPPRLTMEITYTDGTNKNIYFGAQTADMRNYFVMVSGSPSIYLVGNFAVDRAMADLESIIDRTLQHFTADAEYILIAQRDGPAIELAMAVSEDAEALMAFIPDGKILRLIQPFDRGIDHSRLGYNVLEPLSEFTLDRVVSLMPTDLSLYGLDNPSLEFMYQDEFGETHFLFGDIFTEDVNGWDVDFIYVKFADRPHVFSAEFRFASVLFDLNVFFFIDRFIALPSILGVERVTVTALEESRNLDMIINHGESQSIAPTINGIAVEESDFRVSYRLLIALFMEGETEPFTPQVEPDITITYHRPEDPDIEIRLFALDSNLYAVSVNGEDPWFVTHSRDVNAFFNHVTGIIG